jgi:catechol 2,3-dioxygenase-like lactoylglutathione lyase family enzyme
MSLEANPSPNKDFVMNKGTVSNLGQRSANVATVDMKLEVVIIPVTDVDRAKEFYSRLGWRLDADRAAGSGFRLVQFTPPGSGASIQYGTSLTSATPGSAQGLLLIVSDIEAAHRQLVANGIDASEIFHCANGTGCRFSGVNARVNGPHPDRLSYSSFISFKDPDGNGWILQEVTTRLPGRVAAGATSFASVGDLASALRRAAAAHGQHEARIGQADKNWPDWYADFLVSEQRGTELPT